MLVLGLAYNMTKSHWALVGLIKPKLIEYACSYYVSAWWPRNKRVG